MILKKLIFFTTFFLIAQTAFSDILYFDLNFSINEVRALREYAKANKINVHIFPHRTPDDEKIIEPAYRKVDSLWQSLKNCKSNCKKIEEELSKQRNHLSELIGQRIHLMNEKEFTMILSQLQNSTSQIDHLIFSGHSGGLHFSGVLGSIGLQSIKTISDEFPAIKDQLKAILLWGCYAGTLNSLYNEWHKNFPQVDFFAGYENQSPLGIRETSGQYLVHILKNEKLLLAQKNAKDIHNVFKKIPLAAELDGTALIRDIFVSYDEFGTIDEMIQKCSAKIPEQLYNTFICYDDGLAGCENPPENHQGPLRQFYSFVQNNRHCRDLMKEKYPRFPLPEYLIRLIYLDNIKKNFTLHHKDDLSKYDQIIQRQQLNRDYSSESIFKSSRKTNLLAIKSFEKTVSEGIFIKLDYIPEQDLAEQIAIVLSFSALRFGPLHFPLPFVAEAQYNIYFCIPFSWVDIGSTEKDTCWFDKYFNDSEAGKLDIAAMPYTLRFARLINKINPILVPNSNLPDDLANFKSHYIADIEKKLAYYRKLPPDLYDLPFSQEVIAAYQAKLIEAQSLSNNDCINMTLEQIEVILQEYQKIRDSITDQKLKEHVGMHLSFYRSDLITKRSKLKQ